MCLKGKQKDPFCPHQSGNRFNGKSPSCAEDRIKRDDVRPFPRGFLPQSATGDRPAGWAPAHDCRILGVQQNISPELVRPACDRSRERTASGCRNPMASAGHGQRWVMGWPRGGTVGTGKTIVPGENMAGDSQVICFLLWTTWIPPPSTRNLHDSSVKSGFALPCEDGRGPHPPSNSPLSDRPEAENARSG